MITENDVLKAWEAMARQEAAKMIGPLEMEDKEQVGMIGLLYAIRTWRMGMRSFEPYARDCIKAHLLAAIREARRCARAESGLSLDMRLGPESDATYGDYLLTYTERAFKKIEREKIAI